MSAQIQNCDYNVYTGFCASLLACLLLACLEIAFDEVKIAQNGNKR